ncbi:P22 phage major capsid protein family protein [Corynebacterium timonense]|uniref:p22 coat protein-gene protein 5 n=1 Tax=Corynebacterium timonense TaxID=441500 RepID=A0A1H1LQI6_9CORY|nr:P22 phage major capsid protein family protein [Corynebacterium timonense]SDR76600.1 P22 coat protein-gene protein 5 [Corynebacterium timonense]
MSVKTFIPEIWNAAIQEPYEKNLIFGQPSIASNAWMGQITGIGDTVHINYLSAPTVRDYTKGTPIEVEELSTTSTKLNIDQGKYFAFRVHDVDKVQASGDLQGPATRSAGIELRDNADTYLSGLLKDGVLAANKLGTVEVIDDDPAKAGAEHSAFKVLVKLSEKLNRQSVPTTGRYVVVGPGTYSALLMDPRFTRVDASGDAEGLRNGIVGRAVGFDVLVSNNVPVVSGREVAIAGVPDAFAFASQLVETEALRDPSHFGDIVRGLNVYGAAVTRPEGIATAEVKITAPKAATAA